jgi:hypothetical protein
MLDCDPREIEDAARKGPQVKPYIPVTDNKARDTPLHSLGSTNKMGDLER